MAGGINIATVRDYLVYEPDVVIVGGGVFGTDDPVREAKAIYELL